MRSVVAIALSVVVGGCGGSSSPGEGVGVAVVATQPSGNHVLDGFFASDRSPIRFDGPTDPAWLVVGDRGGSPIVVVVDAAGGVSAYVVDDDIRPVEVNLDQLPPGTPPALLEGPGGVLILSPPSTSGSFLSHPVALPGGGLAFVDEAGSLIVSTAAGNRRFDVEALADARPVLSSDGLLAVYTMPTDEYGHGVLGDAVEATRIAIIDTGSLEVVRTIDVPSGEVFEGLSPLWADIDDDALDELVATASGPQDGARLVVYSASGSLLHASAPIGRGFRWRHQLAVGPFGPDGETEVVDVQTPHLGGRLTFSMPVGQELDPVVAPGEYRTHVLGSRNLDQALAVRTADGLAMLVPTQDQRSLALARRVDDGVAVELVAEFDARLATNISGTVIGGQAVVVLGLTDGTVLVWR